MHNFIVGLLLFLAEAAIIGFVGGLIYFIYFSLKSGKLSVKPSRKINMIYISFLSICFLSLFTISYIEVFPGDNFYINEFKYNTGLELPPSADIAEKDATYPDFFGDYWAAAIIELNSEDYKKLKDDISQLKKFQVDTTSQKTEITETYNALTKDIKENDIETVFYNPHVQWFKVAFLKNGRTIIFEKSSS